MNPFRSLSMKADVAVVHLSHSQNSILYCATTRAKKLVDADSVLYTLHWHFNKLYRAEQCFISHPTFRHSLLTRCGHTPCTCTDVSTCTHTHTHTLARAPDHRYCALHESLSTVCGVQCIVGWSSAHAHTVPYLFISLLAPQPLSSPSTTSLSVFPLFLKWRKGEGRRTYRGNAIYRTWTGKWIANAASCFPFNVPHLSQCGHHFCDHSISLPPPLSVHPCTFLFRRAPLVPGTASHTKLMASLGGGGVGGGWSQDGDHRQAQNHSYFWH